MEYEWTVQAPSMHTSEAQSPFAPHTLPAGHVGAHAGAAHWLLVHTPDAQSVAAAHVTPSGQDGSHVVAAQVPSVHTADTQSPFAPHGVPRAHVGAHAGAAQVPSVHTADAQSPFVPHAWPLAHVGEHRGGATQAPPRHTGVSEAHAAGPLHSPFVPHVSTPLPEHRFVPGVQTLPGASACPSMPP
jgi:hypothetical protein